MRGRERALSTYWTNVGGGAQTASEERTWSSRVQAGYSTTGTAWVPDSVLGASTAILVPPVSFPLSPFHRGQGRPEKLSNSPKETQQEDRARISIACYSNLLRKCYQLTENIGKCLKFSERFPFKYGEKTITVDGYFVTSNRHANFTFQGPRIKLPGARPHSLVHVLSVAGFVSHGPCRVAVTGTIQRAELKIFTIWSFAGKNCRLLI